MAVRFGPPPASSRGHPIDEKGRGQVIYDMYSHPLDDEWQRRRSPFWELGKIDIPVLSIGAWGKASLHLRGNFMGYERVSGPKKLLITGANSFAAAQLQYADVDFHLSELLQWYDYHLKGIQNGVMERPAVRFFVQGEGRGARSGGLASAGSRTGDLLSQRCKERIRRLHQRWIAEHGGASIRSEETSWSYPDPKWTAGVTTFDRNGMPDPWARVVTFTTAPFGRDREFTGQGALILYASSDQTDLTSS